jgi:hypothetical protein
MLWNYWWNLVCELRCACARSRTFLWMALCLAGMTTRRDLLGVTSIVRALGLEAACYDRILDLFHSPALDLNKLTRAWCALVFRLDPGTLRVNFRPVLVGDGIQVAKAGRKMPGGRRRPARSPKAPSAIRVQHQAGVHLRPLLPGGRCAHPSLVQRVRPAFGLSHPRRYGVFQPRGRLAQGNHLVTRVKSNSVAFFPATPPSPNSPRPKGRPAKYGKKIKVASLLKETDQLQDAPSPVYGEQGVILTSVNLRIDFC